MNDVIADDLAGEGSGNARLVHQLHTFDQRADLRFVYWVFGGDFVYLGYFPFGLAHAMYELAIIR